MNAAIDIAKAGSDKRMEDIDSMESVAACLIVHPERVRNCHEQEENWNKKEFAKTGSDEKKEEFDHMESVAARKIVYPKRVRNCLEQEEKWTRKIAIIDCVQDFGKNVLMPSLCCGCDTFSEFIQRTFPQAHNRGRDGNNAYNDDPPSGPRPFSFTPYDKNTNRHQDDTSGREDRQPQGGQSQESSPGDETVSDEEPYDAQRHPETQRSGLSGVGGYVGGGNETVTAPINVATEGSTAFNLSHIQNNGLIMGNGNQINFKFEWNW